MTCGPENWPLRRIGQFELVPNRFRTSSEPFRPFRPFRTTSWDADIFQSLFFFVARLFKWSGGNLEMETESKSSCGRGRKLVIAEPCTLFKPKSEIWPEILAGRFGQNIGPENWPVRTSNRFRTVSEAFRTTCWDAKHLFESFRTLANPSELFFLILW